MTREAAFETGDMTVVTVPCLTDNYAFLVHNAHTGDTLLVDVPEAAPIAAALDARGWTLDQVLLTHHHGDHVEGLDPLLKMIKGTPQIIGAAADAHRLPTLDVALAEGDTPTLAGYPARVFDVSGHTIGHIAVHIEAANAVFTADSLMALGCGRLFEGTPAMMWNSLQKLRDLPGDTRVCSGHEYTATNAAFARTIEPDNPDLISRSTKIDETRAAGRPTVPSTLDEELRTNPFLRADTEALQTAVGMAGADSAAVFAHVRKLRDNF